MKTKFMWLLPVLALFAACQEIEEYTPETEQGNMFAVSIDDASRTIIDGLKVSFAKGDKIGITSGPNLNVESVITTSSTGSTFYANPVKETPFSVGDSLFGYYPYSADCKGTTLTFTIPANQVQTDASGSHLAQYDLLIATPKVMKASGNALNFTHTVAWMDFTVFNENKDNAAIESVTIKARNKVFPVKATMNIAAGTKDADYKVFNPIELTDEITVTAGGNGWNIIKNNTSQTLRMAVMPVDLSNEVLTITAKTSRQTYEYKGVGMKLQAGRCYQYECGEAMYELELVGDKEFYIAYEYRSGGAKENNFNSNNSTYSYKRCKQTENVILFWDKSWGDNPTAFDATAILNYAEQIYDSYVNKLGFKSEGKSYLDQYKIQIYILEGHAGDALATGSGYDDKIGALWAWLEGCTAETMAHEIGHSFQYQTYCDAQLDKANAPSTTCGWRYGFGANGAGGNAWWEMCAQWQCYQVYPSGMFSGWYSSFPPATMKHPLHEDPRYANYFIQNFWQDKHGKDFIGKLWRYSKQYEDPIDTYMRLTETSLEEFNNEMFEYACRLQTYDFEHTRANGGDRRWNAFASYTKRNTSGNYYQVTAATAPENYGFNAYRIKAPTTQTEMSVELVGVVGASGYRTPTSSALWTVDDAGWRFGFVAVDKSGKRYYGDAGVATGANGTGTVSFTCPANCQYVWLVVMGAPTRYWHHEWNDSSADDELWPYKFKLTNATLN